jgi:long-chain fatty acid transport protein
MVRRRLSLGLVAVCLTIGMAAMPSSLAASGFQLTEQNASGLGNAFAGQAAGVENASAIYFNPAALTTLKGWNVVASLEPIGLSTTFTDDGSTAPQLGAAPFPVASGTNGGDAGKWIPVPNFYVSKQITDRIWVGAAVNVPFGLETNWDPDWVGRFHATKSRVQAINVNPTVAVKVTDMLSVGVGLDYQHLSADFDQVVAYGGIAYAQAKQAAGDVGANAIAAQIGGLPAALTKEAPVLVSGTSNGWGWNAGVLFAPNDQIKVGVSYRSKVKHDISGDVTFQDVPTFAGPGALGPLAAGINAKLASGPVQATIEMPDTFSVAGSWSKEKLQILADWTFTHWSTIQSLAIYREDADGNRESDAFSSVPLNFQNTWRAGLGASYRLNDAFTLRAGTAYDKSPVQDEFRTPRLPDNDRIWISAGAQWRLNDKFHVDAGYAHLFISDSTSNLPNQDFPTSTPQGALKGTYSGSVNILGIQVVLAF